MKLKEYSEVWPPIVTIGAARASGPALSDTVVSVREYTGAKDRLVLSVRDQHGVTYGIPLLSAGVLESDQGHKRKITHDSARNRRAENLI